MQRHRRLRPHADAAAIFGFCHCNRIARLGIPQPARLAGEILENVTDNQGLVLEDARAAGGQVHEVDPA
tara:strand:+ start:2899 stop:3105 length:207 start_codon:yes stop_codon:yes gene_type:complete